MVAAGVLFRAPAEDAPGPRRRSRKKAAGPAQEPAAGDVDITAAEDVEDAVAEPEDVREAAIEQASGARRRRRRGRRGRGTGARATDAADSAESAEDAEDGETPAAAQEAAEAGEETAEAGTHRRRRRRRAGSDDEQTADEPPNTVTHVRAPKAADDGVKAVKGSTRLEAKRQRRRDGRETTRRRAPIITEAEFLARRESVDRVMAVRQQGDRTQVAVLEDGILVEHYVTRASATSYVGNVYLGRVQNVLPSMEAAFVDISKGRNGVLYAGEVNWDAAGLEGKSRAIENALKSGDTVLAQVTKDPIGHKGARLTSQVSLPGRFLVYVPGGGMTGISRRLPDTERHRLKSILRKIVPEDAGVIVRTAAEGATEEDLTRDVERLKAQWESIEKKAKDTKSAPMLVHGEPDLATRVVRDVFNEDFNALVVQGDEAWTTVSDYIGAVAPDLLERVSKHATNSDLFHDLRVDEQLMKALDRKVWLPSGGSLVIDRTEAMTVIDVNTGKFVGAGGNLEQTVTRNNLEAAEEIVRQLRLRDVGGIVVIDFIDMVLESNRDLVLRRLTECLSRDRTKHQVAEVTSLGLVQMTRKRVGEGLLEAFSETCEVCHGRGVIVHTEPVDKAGGSASGSARQDEERPGGRGKRRRGGRAGASAEPELPPASDEQRQVANAAIAAIHRATALDDEEEVEGDDALADLAGDLVEAAAEATEVAEDIEPLEVVASSPVSAPESDDAADEVERVTVGAEPSPNGVPASVTESPAPTRRRRRVASRPAGPPGAA
jgi:ribonuclease E